FAIPSLSLAQRECLDVEIAESKRSRKLNRHADACADPHDLIDLEKVLSRRARRSGFSADQTPRSVRPRPALVRVSLPATTSPRARESTAREGARPFGGTAHLRPGAAERGPSRDSSGRCPRERTESKLRSVPTDAGVPRERGRS